MKHLKILSALLTLILVASCHAPSDTTLNGGDSATRGGGATPGAWIVPGVGTVYVFEQTEQGSLSGEFDTITIAKTGLIPGGKTNVISYFENPDDQDSEFYGIGTNGNFAFGELEDSLGVEVFLASETYPTGTRQPIAIEPSLDSIEGNERIVRTDIISFVGVENLSLPAGTFSTLHTREADINDEFSVVDSELIPTLDSSFTDIWFAPSLGQYVQWSNNESTDGEETDSSGGELIKFIPH